MICESDPAVMLSERLVYVVLMMFSKLIGGVHPLDSSRGCDDVSSARKELVW